MHGKLIPVLEVQTDHQIDGVASITKIK